MPRRARLRWRTLIGLEAALLGGLTLLALALSLRTVVGAVARWF